MMDCSPRGCGAIIPPDAPIDGVPPWDACAQVFEVPAMVDAPASAAGSALDPVLLPSAPAVPPSAATSTASRSRSLGVTTSMPEGICCGCSSWGASCT